VIFNNVVDIDLIHELESLSDSDLELDKKTVPRRDLKSKLKKEKITQHNANVQEFPDVLRDALYNHIHIKKLGGTLVNNKNIKLCRTLEEFIVHDSDRVLVTTCEPVAKTLRKLTTSGMGNSGLRLCTGLVDLNVDDNICVTTCEPFAESLRILSAQGRCTIGTTGLQLCTRIESLNASK